jgi:uncharacterized MAPEG superfamily protein
MRTALLVLVLVAFIPYILAGLGGYARARQLGHMDNNDPRKQALELSGAGARIVAAQANAWEALAIYSVVIILNSAAGTAWALLSTPALIFALARILHAVCYAANWATLRSIVFVVGLGCCAYMMSMAF